MMTARSKTSRTIVSLFICLSFLGACSSDKPIQTMTNAEISLQRAREAEALEYAPLELRQAEEKMRAARQAMYKEDYTEAKRLAEDAQADARLAEAQSRSVQSQKRTQQMKRSIETFQKDLESTPSSRQGG